MTIYKIAYKQARLKNFRQITKNIIKTLAKLKYIRYNNKALEIREFSSVGRASALQAGGHRFEPYNSHHFRDLNSTLFKSRANLFKLREWLSGRALPCQGKRRGSESRFPLQKKANRKMPVCFFYVRRI